MTHHRTPRLARSGTAAIELAMVLPLLVVLCVAALDLGRAIRHAMRLESAVRRAAEYGATRGVTAYNVGDVRERMQNLVQEEFTSTSGVRNAPLSVDVDFEDLKDTLPRIHVHAEASMVTVVNWGVVPRNFVLQRSFTMRRFR